MAAKHDAVINELEPAAKGRVALPIATEIFRDGDEPCQLISEIKVYYRLLRFLIHP